MKALVTPVAREREGDGRKLVDLTASLIEEVIIVFDRVCHIMTVKFNLNIHRDGEVSGHEPG